MGPLERLLQLATQLADSQAKTIRQLQQQGSSGRQQVTRMVADALRANGQMQDMLAVLLDEDVEGCCSSLERTEQLKAAGNAAFKQQQYSAAIQKYTEALQACEELTPPGAALASALYCNRALALYCSAPPLLRAAAQDATCAISCDPTSVKAWYRRACARRALGDMAGALQDAQHAQRSALAGSSAAEAVRQQAAARDIDALVAGLRSQLCVQEAGGGDSPKVEGGDNIVECWRDGGRGGGVAVWDGGGGEGKNAMPITPAGELDVAATLAQRGSRGALTVLGSSTAGRFLAAAAEQAGMERGRDVLREQPFALALTKAGRRACCHRCACALPQAPPWDAEQVTWYCRGCPLGRYCSLRCREEEEGEEGGHAAGGAQCGRPWGTLLPPEALLALKVALKARRAPSSLEARQVASLETHFAELAPQELARCAALALLTHATWAAATGRAAGGKWAPDPAPPGLPTADDVLAALLQVRVNGVAVVPPVRASAGERLALAVYPSVSMMNHACHPNVALRFEGCVAVVRTLRQLPPGSPLLHCYGPQVGEMTWGQRQLVLQRQYCFRCRCTACAAGPTLADARLVGLRCLRCGGDAGAAAVGAAPGSAGGDGPPPASRGNVPPGGAFSRGVGGTTTTATTITSSCLSQEEEKAGQGCRQEGERADGPMAPDNQTPPWEAGAAGQGAVQLPPCSVPPGLLSRHPLPAPVPHRTAPGDNGADGQGPHHHHHQQQRPSPRPLATPFALASGGSGGGSAQHSSAGPACGGCGAAPLSQKQWEGSYLPGLLEAAQHAQRAEQLTQAAEGSGGADLAGLAVRLLRECLQIRTRLLHPDNQLIGGTHDALARALHAARRPQEACRHLCASLAQLRRQYPPDSTAVAFQQLQLAALLRGALSRGGPGAVPALAGAVRAYRLGAVGHGAAAWSGDGEGGGECWRGGDVERYVVQLEAEAAQVLELHFGADAASQVAGPG